MPAPGLANLSHALLLISVAATFVAPIAAASVAATGPAAATPVHSFVRHAQRLLDSHQCPVATHRAVVAAPAKADAWRLRLTAAVVAGLLLILAPTAPHHLGCAVIGR